jgi:MoaA/NifB/PqqE/SkfB family radical SAM enzyme
VVPVIPLEQASHLDSVDLYITATCNRRCSYCFLDEAFLDSRETMPLPRVVEILDWSVRAGVREITLLGGEPALHPRLPEILAEITVRGLEARLVTNGSARFRALLREPRVRDALSRVAVSLDTIDADLQDRLRGRGAHRDATATIVALRDAGVPFDVNVTGVAEALPGLSALIDYAETAGCRRVNIHWPSRMGLGADLPESAFPSAEQWRDVVALVERVRPCAPGFFVEVERAFLNPGEQLRGCALELMTNLQVMPSGRAYRCGALADEPEMSALAFLRGDLVVTRSAAGEEAVRAAAAGCLGCPLSPGAGQACIYDKIVSVVGPVPSRAGA